jgi:hypothetical protein
MSVLAFSTPRYPGEWRWRIVGYTPTDVIEESTTAFPTMAGALAAGQLRAAQINRRDRSQDHPSSHPIASSRFR